MDTKLKDGTVIHFTKCGTDLVTGRDVYISNEFLPVKFQMHKSLDEVNWKTASLRTALDIYLLDNFDAEFIKALKKDRYGDIISIPSIEELFNPPYDDIFIEAENIKENYTNIDRPMGQIYWLRNALDSMPGMFCSCCSLGGQDIQVQTNYENVRIRVLL